MVYGTERNSMDIDKELKKIRSEKWKQISLPKAASDSNTVSVCGGLLVPIPTFPS